MFPFKCVKSLNKAGGGFVLHNADDLVAGFAFSKYKEGFLGTLFALHTIHIPMPKGYTLGILLWGFSMPSPFGGRLARCILSYLCSVLFLLTGRLLLVMVRKTPLSYL